MRRYRKGMRVAVDIGQAQPADLPELAAVAAATFPLACPPSSAPDNIAAFIAENLSEHRFGEYLADPARVVLLARADAGITGYAMLIHGVPDDDDVQRAVEMRPAIELSKIYVLPERHGTGAASGSASPQASLGSASWARHARMPTTATTRAMTTAAFTAGANATGRDAVASRTNGVTRCAAVAATSVTVL